MDDTFEINKLTEFNSPTHGRVSFIEVADLITEYINKDRDAEYEIAIGTDSMTHEFTKFVIAITVHKISKGGIFFTKTMYHDSYRKNQLFDKLYRETELSLNSSGILLSLMKGNGLDIDRTPIKIRFTVHVDVGNYGKTKDYIKTLVGMVHSYGYDCEFKPNSYAASSIADKISK